MNKEYMYDIGKYTIGVDTNGEDGIGLTVAIINDDGEIHFLGNYYGDNARCVNLLIKENQQLKKQLGISEKARKSGIDYLTSYESISTIQSLDNIEQNKVLDEKTMNEMIRRYSVVHDEVLKMLDIKDSDK